MGTNESLLNSEKSEFLRNLAICDFSKRENIPVHEMKELINCKRCSFSTRNVELAIKHTMMSHNGEYQRCNKCKPGIESFTCFHRKEFFQHLFQRHFRCHVCST